MPAEAAAAVADAPAAPAAAPAAGPRGLRAKYHADVVPALVKQFEYGNPNQVPKLQKIVVNVGLGEALTNAKAIDAASGDLTLITGQKPIVMKARRSIAQFKIRTGNPIGLKVTLRGQRMWDFLERLTLLTLPRIRDFRGIPSRSFDGRGNYTLGMREQIAFPEIDYDKVDRLRGLEISVVTTAKTDEESKRMLELLGMPFAS
jgi:large subunit ribosomal protein L5